MSSYQGRCSHLSIVYLSYDLAWGDLMPRNSIWLAGYKVVFLVVDVKSVTLYVCLELKTILERTKQLQWPALSTTSKGEVLALYREERLSESDSAEARYSKRAFGHRKQILSDTHDQYNPAPVFWCSFMAFLVLYNTAQLALVP